MIIGIVLFILYRKGPDTKAIPPWLIKAIGVFLVIMFLRNLTDAYQFVFKESDSWWPLVKENASNLSEGLRELLQKMMKGA